MIACPICQTQNHHLAVACISCGSFLQTKVETLDLFSTVWHLIESPQKAFHGIAMASHKNYIFVLSALSGIAFIFTLFWIVEIGNTGVPLPNILAAGLILGPLLGIINVLLLALLQKLISVFFGVRAKYKNVFAIIAYACVPIIFSALFVLPIEVLTYGKFLFSTNPSPWTLKPVSYILLVGLDGVCLFWSLMLYSLGVKVLYNVSLLKAIIIAHSTVIVFSAIVCLVFLGISSLQLESNVEKYFTAVVL